MRLPSIRDLTTAQKEVYLYAPTDSHVLVSGPPGTGKTLIACLRAQEMQRRGTPVSLCMFNRVLKRFTENAGGGGQILTDTLTRWFIRWWHGSGLPPHPTCGRVFVNVPFEERAELKALGGRFRWDLFAPWKKNGSKRGVWILDHEVWEASRARVRWPVVSDPPWLDGKAGLVDWAAARTHVVCNDEHLLDEALSLGTIMIDEGQDFPKPLYELLQSVCAAARCRGEGVRFPPRCFGLADENQQITEENSTLGEISASLRVATECRFHLRDNFRNTRPVAMLAAKFYADIVSGLPNLPDRAGERPAWVTAGSLQRGVDFIRTWLDNNPGKEVGVFTFADPRRKEVFAALEESLGPRFRVQSYSSKDEDCGKAEVLVFDEPNTVTVLNIQSCKGLEFDAVFIVDMHDAHRGWRSLDRFKMQMFVAISRAREWACLLDVSRPLESAPHQAVLSSIGEDVLRRMDLSAQATDGASGGGRRAAARAALERVRSQGYATSADLDAFPKAHKHFSGDQRRVALLDGREWDTNGGKYYQIRSGEKEPAHGLVHRAVETAEPPPKPSAAAGPTGWEETVIAIAEAHGKGHADLRSKAGCFWVYGGQDLEAHLAPHGFAYSVKKGGWWKK